ncbi:MAG: oxygen-independent coproporphyrinogen III oxidase, partial [Pseudomonadota bacterium]
MHSQSSPHLIEINADLIRRFGYNHQDYRLYPQTDYLVEAFDARAYAAWINIRKTGRVHRSLSLYIHIPFCNTLCCHCHFNQVIANDNACITRYIDYLLQEIKLQGKLFQDDLKINQLHFGGGTPTLLSTTQLSDIMTEIRRNFNLSREGEFCIEVDPRQTTHA